MPDDQQLLDLMRAAVDTALQQHKDALYLLDGGRWPTAYAVAHLALEECGKAVVCLTAFGMPPQVRAEFAPVYAAWLNRHQDKAGAAYFIRGVFGPLPLQSTDLLSEVVQAAAVSNGLKFRGLYSDIVDGRVLRPADQVTEADAREMTDLLGQTLAALEPFNPELAGESVLTDADMMAFKEMFGTVDLDELAAALEDVDPGEFFAQVRAVILDDAAPPAPVLAMLPAEMREYFESARPAIAGPS